MASQQFNYLNDGLKNAIAKGRVREPFEKFIGTYSTKGSLDSATIKGFQDIRIEEGPESHEFTVSANGPCSVKDMKVGEWGNTLHVTLTWSGVPDYQFPSTVEVQVIDEDGNNFTWNKAEIDKGG